MHSIITQRLPLREYPELKNRLWIERVLNYDPADVYSYIEVDHTKRKQTVGMEKMWPKLNGVCSCGCGKTLTGRQRKWATDDCERFAAGVHNIIGGDTGTIGFYLAKYFDKYECAHCGSSMCPDMEDRRWAKRFASGNCEWLEKDHIISVKAGGGGCWLSNYQLLCLVCHQKKSARDRVAAIRFSEPLPLPALNELNEIF